MWCVGCAGCVVCLLGKQQQYTQASLFPPTLIRLSNMSSRTALTAFGAPLMLALNTRA